MLNHHYSPGNCREFSEWMLKRKRREKTEIQLDKRVFLELLLVIFMVCIMEPCETHSLMLYLIYYVFFCDYA